MYVFSSCSFLFVLNLWRFRYQMILIYDFSIHRQRVATRDHPEASLIESFERQMKNSAPAPVSTNTSSQPPLFLCDGRKDAANSYQPNQLKPFPFAAHYASVESSSIFLSCDCKRSAWQLTRCPNTAVSNSSLRPPSKKKTIQYNKLTMNSLLQRGPIQWKNHPPKSHPPIPTQNHQHQCPSAPSVAPPGARQLPSHGCVFAQASGSTDFHWVR